MRIDRTGQTFHRMTILSQSGFDSLCRCECGTEKTVRTANLVNGMTKSCGCLLREKRENPDLDRHGKIIDLTGQTFGLLTALRRHPKPAKMGALWVCECACGNEHVAPGYALRRGQVKSCGCWPPSIEKLRAAHQTRRAALEIIRRTKRVSENTGHSVVAEWMSKAEELLK